MIALLPIFYRDAKRRYTFPRLGYVKFDEQTGVSVRTIKLATSLAALLFVVGLLVFFSGFPDNNEWLNPLVENWELTAGVIGLLTLSLFGYTSKVRRFYYDAGISFILFIASFLISVQGYYVLPVLGGIVALNGFFHLYTFTQEYPLRQRRKNDKVKNLDISELDKLIHEPVRLSILAHLYVLKSADALFLKNQIGLTWGNLSTHLKRIEEAGYIEVTKEFVDRKPVTSLKLTDSGRQAFNQYRERMSNFLNKLPE